MADVLTDEELADFRCDIDEAEAGVDGNLWAVAADLIFRGGNGQTVLTLDQVKRLLATVDARAARIRELEDALEATEGLLNEMHPHVQGHSHERCTRRTDFCITSVQVAAALRGDQ